MKRICKKCGASVNEGEIFCNMCGTNVEIIENVSVKKSSKARIVIISSIVVVVVYAIIAGVLALSFVKEEPEKVEDVKQKVEVEEAQIKEKEDEIVQSVKYTKENFIEDVEGIWVNMNTYTSVGFEFLSFHNGEYYSGAYPGGGDRTGYIVDVQKFDDTYIVKLHYLQEEFMGDFYEEEYLDWKIQISNNCLTTINKSNNAKSKSSWVYKGKNLEEAKLNMAPLLKEKIILSTTTDIPYRKFGKIATNAILEYFNGNADVGLNRITGDNECVVNGVYGPENRCDLEAYTTDGIDGNITQIMCDASVSNPEQVPIIVKELLASASIYFTGASKSEIVDNIYDNLTIIKESVTSDKSARSVLSYYTMGNIEVFVEKTLYLSGYFKGSFAIRVTAQVIGANHYWKMNY